MTMYSNIRRIILENIDFKYLKPLSKLKWFILTPFTSDTKTIQKKYTDEIEIKIIEELISSIAPSAANPPVIIDIGANIGLYSYFITKSVEKYKGTCIAFEPRSDIYNRLVKNIESDAFVPEKLAVSNKTGQAELFLPESHGLSSLVEFAHFKGFKTEQVTLTTLDLYVAKKEISWVSFIKIDVEGHEPEVIEGGSDIFRKFRPILLCEIENRHLNPRGKSVQDVINQIRNFQYDCYVIYNQSLEPLNDKDLDIPPDRLEQGEYCNNYWFLPQEKADLPDKLIDIFLRLRHKD